MRTHRSLTTDMKDRLNFFLITALCSSCYSAGASSRTVTSDALSASDLLKLVNPFIGTTNGGNVFPGESRASKSSTAISQMYYLGATIPHGMAKVGMDTDSPHNVSKMRGCNVSFTKVDDT